MDESVDAVKFVVVSGIAETRRYLIDKLISLKYATTVPEPSGPCGELSELEFLNALCTWVTEYAKVLDTVKKTNAEMSQELYDLREQRRAVRAFLGIKPGLAIPDSGE